MHAYHESLPGFDERNVWHDGCAECEDHAMARLDGLGRLDDAERVRTWQRMREYRWGAARTEIPEWVSGCDRMLIGTLYHVALFLEHCGLEPERIQTLMAIEATRRPLALSLLLREIDPG
jgi:hypothetical protein